jgi:hypothetical protein
MSEKSLKNADPLSGTVVNDFLLVPGDALALLLTLDLFGVVFVLFFARVLSSKSSSSSSLLVTPSISSALCSLSLLSIMGCSVKSSSSSIITLLFFSFD